MKTITTTIYTTWLTRNDLARRRAARPGPARVVALLVVLERAGRRRQRFAGHQRLRQTVPVRLSPARGLCALVLCALPVLGGFALPFAHLLHQALQRLGQGMGVSNTLVRSLGNTLLVALLTTGAALLVALVLAWAQRLAQARREGRLEAGALRLASIGYAIPGDGAGARDCWRRWARWTRASRRSWSGSDTRRA